MPSPAKILIFGCALLGLAAGVVALNRRSPSDTTHETRDDAEEGVAPSVAAREAKPAPEGRVGPTEASYVLAPIFDILDCDRVGAIDSGQVDEHVFEVFRPNDRDRSRRLSAKEFGRTFTRGGAALRTQLFRQADRNGDEQLTANEYQGHLYAMVELADTNRDGEVTRQELESHTAGPH